MEETAIYQLGAAAFVPKVAKSSIEDNKTGKDGLQPHQSNSGCAPNEESHRHEKISGTDTLDKGLMEYGYVIHLNDFILLLFCVFATC